MHTVLLPVASVFVFVSSHSLGLLFGQADSRLHLFVGAGLRLSWSPPVSLLSPPVFSGPSRHYLVVRFGLDLSGPLPASLLSPPVLAVGRCSSVLLCCILVRSSTWCGICSTCLLVLGTHLGLGNGRISGTGFGSDLGVLGGPLVGTSVLCCICMRLRIPSRCCSAGNPGTASKSLPRRPRLVLVSPSSGPLSCLAGSLWRVHLFPRDGCCSWGISLRSLSSFGLRTVRICTLVGSGSMGGIAPAV